MIYLLHYQLLPEDRLAELMADLFGVKLAAVTIARMSRTCTERLRGFMETVRDLVTGAPVKHMDESPRSWAMWARFTVLSETPIASAIAGCAIPLSRSNII